MEVFQAAKIWMEYHKANSKKILSEPTTGL